ncbi:aconitase X catalytic domain-containing protein [Mesorhizobium sp. CA8]|uniref:aconitase X n=1 Tax=unclassified Mesorhizobium TaxID=325217 RepID=UPI001CCDA7AD|nr:MULTISPECIES: aconitase X catalytic domain-containing protein [unclassified Mesorhizobium]MBZ9765050.1 aconitase X catalytic domain-containing protein [Mesorhizobium sp. CA8]MBZ9823488.1 aconitase X catalytic domain-containing protein [Mesorhizobium sp. CA4]
MVALTDHDLRTLDGQNGDGAALAMKLVVGMAESLDAPNLIDVSSAHITGCFYNGQPSLDFAEKLAAAEARVSVTTTLNSTAPPACLFNNGCPDLLSRRYSSFSAECADGARLMHLYTALGCRPTFTCAPYDLPSVPKRGDQIAWAESNAVMYANSVLGARTNKYGEFIDISAAITGRVPNFGLHRDENRHGSLLVEVLGAPEDRFELQVWCNLLGLAVGCAAKDRIPVLLGMPKATNSNSLRHFGAAASVVSGLAMFHAVGLTPEAASCEEAFGGAEPEERVSIDAKQIAILRNQLLGDRSAQLTAVCLGTPHMSLAEFREVIDLLDGRKVSGNVRLIITTNRHTLRKLRDEKLENLITQAGAEIIVDTCSYIPGMLDEAPGLLMSNSSKWAFRAPNTLKVNACLGTTRECIESAVRGRVSLDRHAWN